MAIREAPRHLAPRERSNHRKLIIGVVAGVVLVAGGAAGAVVATSGSSPRQPAAGSPAAAGSATTSVPAAPTTPDTALQAALRAAVRISPAPGTTAVGLNAPVVVQAGQGKLTSVTVATAAGTKLAGTLDPTGAKWTSTAPALAAGTVYHVNAAVTGEGVSATTSSTFSTLSPASWVGVTMFPDSGLSVGVGQPVVLHFSESIPTAGRAGVLAHLHLAMSKPVPVGAYWFSSTELHLRPQTYWPTGERVSFSDDLDGWNAGSGKWGQGSGSVRFTIGDARISTANLATDVMTVTDNGKLVATYPISGGSTQYPTMNGTHIVLDRSSVVRMNSATVGIPVNSPNGYDELVYWDVHISDSGEYVHAAPWSVGAQGHTNVSHGCVNISPTNAQQFFNFSRVGDVVIVEGGPRPPAVGDHGVMDWGTPWASWTPVPVSALA
jgi:lipoprotein-anchoring transpeptidase ErfK/SrfK